MTPKNNQLPCFPCPHRSACCRWGTWLTEEEGWKIFTKYPDKVYFDEDVKNWRTQIWDGRCVFYNNGGCTIHNEDFYPSSCKDFPYKDMRNPLLPRAFDAITCPEIEIDAD
jgi:Fe-S-cluster containining protein